MAGKENINDAGDEDKRKPPVAADRATEGSEEEQAAAAMVPVQEILRKQFGKSEKEPLPEEMTAGDLEAVLKPTKDLLSKPGVGNQIVPLANDYLAAVQELNMPKTMTQEEKDKIKDFDAKMKAAEKEAAKRLAALEERIAERVDRMGDEDLGGKSKKEVTQDILAIFKAEVETQVELSNGEKVKERMEASGKAPAKGGKEEAYAAADVDEAPTSSGLPPQAKGKPLGKKGATYTV
ncbi:MAG: hypothetical protein EBV03_02040 [Proteobacteria bacterium]|nr:hypothetical protein [Pseudomonadota bacterium]